MASAQFRDLDAAMSNLERGFGGGEVDAIVAGIPAGGQVQLQFPGLTDERGSFSRDEAAYLLGDLFSKVEPSGFERVNVRGQRAEGQHHIRAVWTINSGSVNLEITLQQQGDGYAVVAVSSS